MGSQLSSYHDQGYYHWKALLPTHVCDALLKAFREEVSPYDGLLPRSTTSKHENHYFSEDRLVTNPLLHVHELPVEEFPNFVSSVFHILSDPGLISALSTFLNDVPLLLQSAYYESSSGSPLHIDSHFFDSPDHKVVGCQIALEDIDEKAAAFILYPKSQLLGREGVFSNETNELFAEHERLMLRGIRGHYNNGTPVSLAEAKTRSKLLRRIFDNSGLKVHVPKMNTGDVVFFSSRVIHGGHAPSHSGFSRNTLVGHFAPLSQDVVRYQERREKPFPRDMHGVMVHPSHFDSRD